MISNIDTEHDTCEQKFMIYPFYLLNSVLW